MNTRTTLTLRMDLNAKGGEDKTLKFEWEVPMETPEQIDKAIFLRGCIYAARQPLQDMGQKTKPTLDEVVTIAREVIIRKATRTGVSIEARQEAWDKKAAGLQAAGLNPEDFIG